MIHRLVPAPWRLRIAAPARARHRNPPPLPPDRRHATCPRSSSARARHRRRACQRRDHDAQVRARALVSGDGAIRSRVTPGTVVQRAPHRLEPASSPRCRPGKYRAMFADATAQAFRPWRSPTRGSLALADLPRPKSGARGTFITRTSLCAGPSGATSFAPPACASTGRAGTNRVMTRGRARPCVPGVPARHAVQRHDRRFQLPTSSGRGLRRHLRFAGAGQERPGTAEHRRLDP